jgi:hypothetical protein
MTRPKPANPDERIASLEATIADLERRNDHLMGAIIKLSQRLSTVESTLGLDVLPDQPTGLTVKMAAFDSGYSVSWIMNGVYKKTIKAERIGGRWFIDPASLPVRR